MAAPSQDLLHSMTDDIAARVAAELAAVEAQNVGRESVSLWNKIDGSGDPALENHFQPLASAVDKHTLPEQFHAPAARIFIGGQRGEFLGALPGFVVTEAGGSHTSFAAYLEAVSASLHPLAAEVLRARNTTVPPARVFPPAYQARPPARVYAGTDGDLTDVTAALAAVAGDPVALLAEEGAVAYFGSPHRSTALALALETLADPEIEFAATYWNGSAWAPLPGLADGSDGFTERGVLAWTLPGDWVRSYHDASDPPEELADRARLYYVRLERLAGEEGEGGTAPEAILASLVTRPVLAGNNHLGVQQPPLALGTVTDANEVEVTPLLAPDPARFAPAASLRLRALTEIGETITLTFSYLNQAGEEKTQEQAPWSAPDAGDTLPLVLAAGDTGVTAIRAAGWAATVAATRGVFAVEVLEARTPAL